MRQSALRRLVIVGVAASTMLGGASVAASPPSEPTPSDTEDFDRVLYWNDVLLQAFRDAGGPPTTLSRAGAMMHTAIYDTVNSLEPIGEPYIAVYPQDPEKSYSMIDNINLAAVTVLRAVFRTINFDDELAAAAPPPGPIPVNPDNLGDEAADGVLAARADDGSTVFEPPVPSPPPVPGEWRPTGSGPAVTPHWGGVDPFGIQSGSQFRPPLPGGFSTYSEILESGAYTEQYNRVRRFGEEHSRVRTEAQTDSAFFWANDLDGTYKTPGQLLAHTVIVAVQEGETQTENAKLFALVSIALADAAIAAWDSKYLTPIDLWRPETAVAESPDDGNPDTNPDPIEDPWEPLSQDQNGVNFSPAFPAYISGHATFAGAWAGVMRRYFDDDNIAFTATTEDPNAISTSLDFPSFTAAARDNADSRVYLGVHFQWDADLGYDTGSDVGRYVFNNLLN